MDMALVIASDLLEFFFDPVFPVHSIQAKVLQPDVYALIHLISRHLFDQFRLRQSLDFFHLWNALSKKRRQSLVRSLLHPSHARRETAPRA